METEKNRLKTGDIILVHTKVGVLPKLIQHFQQKEDLYSGRYNHSVLVYEANGKVYAAEMNYRPHIQGIKKFLTASFVFTPIENYTQDDKFELLVLKPKDPVDKQKFGEKLFEFVGTPYDIQNLTSHQRKRIKKGEWKGKVKNASEELICHELVMTTYQEYRPGYFPKCYEGSVKDIYYSDKFSIGIL